jgi:DNA-binding sugar fermentation-stimulating protein
VIAAAAGEHGSAEAVCDLDQSLQSVVQGMELVLACPAALSAAFTKRSVEHLRYLQHMQTQDLVSHVVIVLIGVCCTEVVLC